MKIAIGSDHAGYEYKHKIINHLESKGFEVVNYGTDTGESVDYPDFIHPVADDVNEKKVDFGVILCGSGNGAAMTANKYENVRAALSWNKEVAELGRAHNDANILDIPARYVDEKDLTEIVDAFLKTDFEGGRHQRRVEKINPKG